MSAIDPTPSTVATNALQGIPFSAIIGGPLQAAIDAQAMAAQSTVNFIEQVGFTPGTNTIQNVTFTYQNGAQMVNLIVPLLAIVPIPAIVVTDITIDFTAKLNAASSSVASQNASSSTTAGGSVGYSGWGLTANFNASYSSNSGSSSSQSSKYSIEYTLTIHVEAKQADLPPGLQTILNILSNASQSANPNGAFQVQVPPPTPNNFQATVTATLLNESGQAAANVPVTIGTISGDPNPPTLSATAATTDGNGQFQFGVNWSSVGTTQVVLSGSIPGAPNAASATIGIPFLAPNPGSVVIQLSNTTEATQNVAVTVLDQNGNTITSGNSVSFAGTGVTFTTSPATTATAAPYQATLTAALASPGPSPTTVPCTATGTALPGSSVAPSASFQLTFPASS